MPIHELKPGVSLGPYKLGATLDELLTARQWQRDDRSASATMLSADGWYLFFDDEVLTQIGAEVPVEVQGPYNLQLGISLSEVDGDLVWNPDDCVLGMDGEPGLAIDISDEGNQVPGPLVSSDERILWLSVNVPRDDAPDFLLVELV